MRGEPLLIVSPTPDQCSAAVVDVISIISPVWKMEIKSDETD
jgi:hypothetical protein